MAAARADADQMAACCNNLERRVEARDRSIRGYKGVLGRLRNRQVRKEGDHVHD